MSEHDDEQAPDETPATPDEPDAEEAADDDEQTADDEPEPELTAPAPPTQQEIEARLGKLEREADRHAKRVAEIMGEDFAMLVPSPLDWTPGFVFAPGVAPLDPAAVQATQDYLGMGAAAGLRDDPERNRCELCDGYGVLRTGSRIEAQAALQCRDCNGQGWYGNGNPKREPLPPVATFPITPTAATTTTVPLPPPNTPVQAADRWGRPAGHPHYNLDPATVGVA